MENLLEETKEKLAICHKAPKDVLWIGTDDGSESITWEEFGKHPELPHVLWLWATPESYKEDLKEIEKIVKQKE